MEQICAWQRTTIIPLYERCINLGLCTDTAGSENSGFSCCKTVLHYYSIAQYVFAIMLIGEDADSGLVCGVRAVHVQRAYQRRRGCGTQVWTHGPAANTEGSSAAGNHHARDDRQEDCGGRRTLVRCPSGHRVVATAAPILATAKTLMGFCRQSWNDCN